MPDGVADGEGQTAKEPLKDRGRGTKDGVNIRVKKMTPRNSPT